MTRTTHLSRPFLRLLVPLLLLPLLLTWPLAGLGATTELIHARLSLMRDVAVYKWQHQIPVEDLEREAIVLQNAASSALRYGIQPASYQLFTQLQMDAAKEIQQYWFGRWVESPPASGADREPIDLAGVIRPRLIDLGNQIAASLSHPHRAEIHNDALVQALSVEGLSTSTRYALAMGLTEIKVYDHRLHQILDSGVLRVGTTGDYQPFSFRGEDEQAQAPEYQGIDIDLATDLAQALGVRLVWVQTSWPTLMADLQSGAWDIGMSGISRNTERQKTALFSVPYHQGGKTPIARCSDIDRYSSLASIDQEDVRLIVNPGGTNERFVRSNIKSADIRVFPDNRTIFNEIIDGRADVMITDAIEVRLKASMHPSLCGTMRLPLTYLEKAYLLPQDTIWKHFVDTWLELRIGDGTVKAAYDNHLDSPSPNSGHP